MSTVTPYLNLVKPAPLENFSRATYNTNLDLIDAKVLSLSKNDKEMIFTTAAGFVWGGAMASWQAGLLIQDVSAVYASQLSPGAAFAASGTATGQLKFTEPGIYDVTWNTGNDANPGEAGYRIEPVGTWPGSMGSSQFLGQTIRHNAAFFFESFVHAISIRVPTANLEILFKGQQTNGTTNYPRIKVMKKAAL